MNLYKTLVPRQDIYQMRIMCPVSKCGMVSGISSIPPLSLNIQDVCSWPIRVIFTFPFFIVIDAYIEIMLHIVRHIILNFMIIIAQLHTYCFEHNLNYLNYITCQVWQWSTQHVISWHWTMRNLQHHELTTCSWTGRTAVD